MRSRPFVWPALGLMMGMAVAHHMNKVPFFFGGVVVLWFIAVGVALVAHKKTWWVGAAGFCFGALLMTNAMDLPPGHIEQYFSAVRGKPVPCQGSVITEIDMRRINGIKRGSFTVDLNACKMDGYWQKVSGKVLVQAFSPGEVQYGDEVMMTGKISRPFEAPGPKTSYRDYLRRKGIYAAMILKKSSPVQILRRKTGISWNVIPLVAARKAKNIYAAYFSPYEASLMNALVLGDQGDVPRYIRTIFARTGTTHLLAVSGFNVGIVAFGAFLLLKLLPVARRLRFLMTIVIVIFYSLVTGGSSAVVRAAVMSSVFLAGFLLEREADVFNSLALSAFLILVWDPMQLFDIGFQLSFACVVSILLFSPFWAVEGSSGGKVGRFLLEALGVTLAATLGSIALTSYYFGYVSPVSLVSNIPLVPLIALITVLGAGILLFFWCPFIAGLFAVCTKVALNMAVGVVYLFSLVPGGAYPIENVSMWCVVCFYGCLLGVWFLIRRMRGASAEGAAFWGLGL